MVIADTSVWIPILQFRGYFTSALCNPFLQVNPDSQKFLATPSELSILCNGERAYMIYD